LGGNIATGAYILVAILLLLFVVEFLETDTVATTGLGDCEGAGNATVCQSASTGSFLSAVLDIDITSIDGAPDIVNGFYLLLLGAALTVGVLLIVLGIASVPFGGG
jgi:hypothetical protein